MSENMKQSNIRIITECAILIAVGTILAQIKIFRMPSGGSVTAASMVPFLLIAYRHGTKWGLLSGFVNALLQMLLGSIYPPVAPGAFAYVLEILLDYILAYMLLGLSPIFIGKKKNFLSIGISSFISILLRFICAFVSGFLVWADIMQDGFAAVIYSLTYNASYMIPEAIVTIVVLLTLYKAYPKLFTFQK